MLFQLFVNSVTCFSVYESGKEKLVLRFFHKVHLTKPCLVLSCFNSLLTEWVKKKTFLNVRLADKTPYRSQAILEIVH